MTRPDDGRPSWMGAPGYSPPPPNLAPHAPMPGAPPYPPHVEEPLPPVGGRGRTRYLRALGAAAVWAAVDLVLLLVLSGPFPSAAALGREVGELLGVALLAALGVWPFLRTRAHPFWVPLLVVLPLFVVLRVVISAVVGAS